MATWTDLLVLQQRAPRSQIDPAKEECRISPQIPVKAGVLQVAKVKVRLSDYQTVRLCRHGMRG